jgi:hypothetical protein
VTGCKAEYPLTSDADATRFAHVINAYAAQLWHSTQYNNGSQAPLGTPQALSQSGQRNATIYSFEFSSTAVINMQNAATT